MADPKKTDGDGAAALEAVILQKILEQYEEKKRPLVNRRRGTAALEALGLPLPLGTVRDLLVETHILGGEAVGVLDDYVEQARAYIQRRMARPNLKAQAAAKARAAKGGAAADPAEPVNDGAETATRRTQRGRAA